MLVLDSGVPRSLATSGYNQRRAECEDAAQRLGVRALRDIHDVSAADALPELLRRRVRHVVSENARVLAAAGSTSAGEFGKLMNASHASLRDDYQVSVSQLDNLVALLQENADVYGARLTGAGFGGACVALYRLSAVQEIARSVLHSDAAAGFMKGCLLVPPQKDEGF